MPIKDFVKIDIRANPGAIQPLEFKWVTVVDDRVREHPDLVVENVFEFPPSTYYQTLRDAQPKPLEMRIRTGGVIAVYPASINYLDAIGHSIERCDCIGCDQLRDRKRRRGRH